jgi:sporulation protein YabP
MPPAYKYYICIGGFHMEEKKMLKSKPHNITIEGRERLIINGVRDVTSFDDNEVALDTEAGGLTIKGTNLHINKLSVDDGNLFVEGYIISCVYSDKIDIKRTGSFLSNIFK